MSVCDSVTHNWCVVVSVWRVCFVTALADVFVVRARLLLVALSLFGLVSIHDS